MEEAANKLPTNYTTKQSISGVSLWKTHGERLGAPAQKAPLSAHRWRSHDPHDPPTDQMDQVECDNVMMDVSPVVAMAT